MPETNGKHEFPELRGLSAATARFLACLPALLLAMLCLRLAEVAAAAQPGLPPQEFASLALGAVGVDLVNLGRYLLVLFLASLPFLLIRGPRKRLLGLGLAWTLPLLVQAVLVQYFLTARVPLGADAFAYSSHDIQSTVDGGLAIDPVVATGTGLAVLILWLVLAARNRIRPQGYLGAALLLAASLVAFLFAPGRSEFPMHGNEDARTIKVSKLSYFVDDNLLYLLRPSAAESSPSSIAPEAGIAGFRYLDARFPFLHAEQTPDVLGPLFNIRPGPPPNIVFVVVEGLGRSFSGPGASKGSFTPELDRLAARSLYWENFLAVQGRTFAVLPSLFGSLPFGENGLAALGEQMPGHVSLLSVLKDQGYWLKVYTGYNSDFDNESVFFKRQGVDVLVDRFNFGKPYQISNSWGFADGDLVSRALDAERGSIRQPFMTVLKTMTMHTPYTFAGQSEYYPRFERHLDRLGIAEPKKEKYRVYRDIYTSILYADQALGRFFEQAKGNPGYENTVFVLLGDHRLPEIPMDTRIERYHVPLMIFSPLLKAPARIKSVSSHFDITPTLLAFLSHNYGLRTPRAVTWLGSGLDTEPTFRNLHVFPLKQTKTNLVDFVSEEWFINHDQLYTLSHRMNIEPNYDQTEKRRVLAQFATFKAANDQLSRGNPLMPSPTDGQSGQYFEHDRPLPPPPRLNQAAVLSVRDVRLRKTTASGLVNIDAVFANTGPVTSETFVPIVILLSADGTQLSETYGSPQRLLAGQPITLRLAVGTEDVSAGHYYLAVIASHPKTGKRIGTGKHRFPIQIDD